MQKTAPPLTIVLHPILGAFPRLFELRTQAQFLRVGTSTLNFHWLILVLWFHLLWVGFSGWSDLFISIASQLFLVLLSKRLILSQTRLSYLPIACCTSVAIIRVGVINGDTGPLGAQFAHGIFKLHLKLCRIFSIVKGLIIKDETPKQCYFIVYPLWAHFDSMMLAMFLQANDSKICVK